MDRINGRGLLQVAGVAVVLAIAGLAYLSRAGGGDADLSRPSSAAGERQTTFILNEIRISGDPQFIELKNTDAGPASPSGLALVSAGARFDLPAGLPAVPGRGVVVLLFDGRNLVDGNALHAPLTRVFAAGGDTLALQAGETILDMARWGIVERANVYLGTGGRAHEPEIGSVIVRPPDATASSAPWIFLGPEEGSPGRPNPATAVSAFAVPDGALFLSSPRLAWYSVPGAASYSVEVSSGIGSSSPSWTATVVPSLPDALQQLSVEPTGLAAGRHSWRVAVVYRDGSSAMSSGGTFRTSVADTSVTVGASPGAGSTPGRSDSAASGSSPTPTPAFTPVVKRVTVPQIYQRKDTQLLHVQNPSETGAMAWDRPDAEGSHDRPYCAPAAIAMATAFFGGRVSVDRLRHEAFRNDSPGPEDDFQETGLVDPQINRAAAWAMSPAPVYHQNNTIGAVFAWISTIRTEIDAGRPLMASYPRHMFLIVGYTEDDGEGHFAFLFKDGNGTEELIAFNPADLPSQDPNYRLRQSGVDAYWTFSPGTAGRTEENTVATDSDRDGVMDFDETERFKTSLSSADSDGDGIGDKEEVRASVWDSEDGYHVRPGMSPPRDHDRDGLATEKDLDSDNGGCVDGAEDSDANGHREEGAGETSVFKKADDGCSSDPSPRIWSGVRHEDFFTERNFGFTRTRLEVNFTLTEGRDAAGQPAWTSRVVRWSYQSETADFNSVTVEDTEPDARGSRQRRYRQDTRSTCAGSGTVNLGPSAITDRQLTPGPEHEAGRRPACVTEATARDTGETTRTTSTGDPVGFPGVPGDHQLEGGRYNESWYHPQSRGFYGGAFNVTVSNRVTP